MTIPDTLIEATARDRQPGWPRDNLGRFVPLTCPLCGGRLIYQGYRVWECDGLVDPGSTDKELECCPFDHFDGEVYRERKWS